MHLALKMLGVDSETHDVFGSDNDGECTTPDWRGCGIHGLIEWLIINYQQQYHGFVGCCVVDGQWYSLFPPLSGVSSWDILEQVAGPPNYQRWCVTMGEGGVLEVPPSEPHAIVIECQVEPLPPLP